MAEFGYRPFHYFSPNMVRRNIDYAVQCGVSLMIGYSKDGKQHRNFHLYDVVYSPKLGKDYIVGYSFKLDKELVFSVNKITSAEIKWIDVLNTSIHSNQDGLYITVIRGDMCLGFELRNYTKEDWSDYVTGIFNRDRNILAFHFVPYFNLNDNWMNLNGSVYGDIKLKSGIYTFAFDLVGDIGIEEDDEYSPYISWRNPIQYNGICYQYVYLGLDTTINALKLHPNIRLLAYDYSPIYSDDDLYRHWELAKKMGLIKE